MNVLFFRKTFYVWVNCPTLSSLKGFYTVAVYTVRAVYFWLSVSGCRNQPVCHDTKAALHYLILTRLLILHQLKSLSPTQSLIVHHHSNAAHCLICLPSHSIHKTWIPSVHLGVCVTQMNSCHDTPSQNCISRQYGFLFCFNVANCISYHLLNQVMDMNLDFRPFLLHLVTVQSQWVLCVACENEGQMGQNDFIGKINTALQCSTLVQYLSPGQPQLPCSTQQETLLISIDMCSVCVCGCACQSVWQLSK